MKNFTNRKRNRVWLIITVSVLALFSVLLVWDYFVNPIGPKSPTRSLDENQTIKPNASKQDAVTENRPNTSNNDGGKTPIQNEGNNPNLSEGLTGFLTNRTVNVASGQLTIRVTIDQLVQTTGTCTLKLTSTNPGKIVIKTAPIIDNPSSSSCQGFDVPLLELSSGKWQISVEIRNSTKSGSIDGGEVVIP